jgi:hypothetical protein
MRQRGKRIDASLLVAMAVLAVSPASASVEISSKPTHKMTCSGGVCSPTAKDAVLNATDLANMLAASDVKIVTGSGAVTITVASSFSWTSKSRLMLDANYNVSFKAPVTVAGPGGLTITSNDGGTGGDVIFFEGAKVDFWDTKSKLIINGGAYKLVSSLPELANQVMHHGKANVALSQDYDASADGTYLASPINAKFYGNFEGLGHTISNLSIGATRPPGKKPRWDYVGLFRILIYPGSIKSLHLANETLSAANKTYLGGLVGENGGLVEQCTASVSINSSSIAGGLVGANYSIIRNTSANVAIVGKSAGGIAGWTQGLLEDSVATGSVSAKDSAGGIAGGNEGTISGSSSSATVQATGDTYGYAGGIAGLNYGGISLSHATGTASGLVAGGLAGFSWYGTIDQSYATGAVTGAQYAGGLVASTGVTVSNSYATGDVSAGTKGVGGGLVGLDADEAGCCASTVATSYSIGRVSGGTLIGGSIGQDTTKNPGVTNAYWDLDTSGVDDPAQGAGSPLNDPGITGLSDAQLKSGLPSGFDPALWGIQPAINAGYPYLLANPPQ